MSTELIPNHVDVKTLNPKLDEKYSPNLYNFLRSSRRKLLSQFAHVYKDKTGTLWLGFIEGGHFTGARLISILCEGNKTPVFSFFLKDLGKLTPIKSFWKTYQKIGRCAIDPKHQEHFQNSESRWKTNGKTRHCQWCKKVSQKEIQVKKITNLTQWKTLPQSRPKTSARTKPSTGRSSKKRSKTDSSRST